MSTDRPKRSGVLLCYPFETKRLAKWTPPYVIQPKLDGERCRLIVRADGGALLLSSTEEIITSVPHINRMAPHVMPVGEWDGELYVHGWTFEQIHSVVSRTVNLHENYAEMQFHCFDHVVFDEPQLSRTITMKSLDAVLGQAGHFRVVPSFVANDLDDIMKLRTKFLVEGYEGIIVRHSDATYVRKRSTGIMKFKPKKTDAYLIVGHMEERDKYGYPKNRLGALVCRGDDGTEFNVGSGFTAAQRESLWVNPESLHGLFVKIEYQAMTPGRGVPRFPIFCSIIGMDDAGVVEPNRRLY